MYLQYVFVLTDTLLRGESVVCCVGGEGRTEEMGGEKVMGEDGSREDKV